MSPKYLWIALIIATMVFSPSCRPGAAKGETKQASVWQTKAPRKILRIRFRFSVTLIPRIFLGVYVCLRQECSLDSNLIIFDQ